MARQHFVRRIHGLIAISAVAATTSCAGSDGAGAVGSAGVSGGTFGYGGSVSTAGAGGAAAGGTLETGGTGMATTGGTGGVAPAGTGGVATTGGSWGVGGAGFAGMVAGGTGGNLATGGTGGNLATAGTGGSLATAGTGGNLVSGGMGGTQVSGGQGGSLVTGGTGGTPVSGGQGGTLQTGGMGGAVLTGGWAGEAGTAGTGASGGVSGSAGSGGVAGPIDCNDVTDQPILEVARDGSGQYSTVQAALDSLSGSNTTPTQIRIKPGTYDEKLVVDKPFVTLCGQRGQTESTIITHGDNANTPDGNGGTLGTSGSTSVKVTADDVSAENLTFRNSTPLGGSQAVAMRISSDRVQFRDCRFLSFQDTLYVYKGSQYFRDCYVEGSVDYVFGAATAILENCTIHNAASGTAATAPSTEEGTPFGIVFLGGRLTAAPGVSNGSVALGRNWRPYGSTVYIGTELGAHIKAVGWERMSDNVLETARFAEYRTTGPGANPGARAPQSRQLSDAEAAQYTVDNIFGSWTPSYSR